MILSHDPQAKPEKHQYSARDGEQGFTLVELLVVLAIIGLIAALATPQVLRYLGSARVDTTKAQIHNFESALELYYIDTGRYPTSEEGLGALQAKPASESRWNGPYIKQSGAFVDAWGTAYQYKSPADTKPFQIISLGRDRKQGGEGPDADIANN
ncbi:type II secretion system major pseudopilin GspG [Phyllobacterium myrsinacearum]|uniref:Type II secretion system core protein G n=1 Tax=Phyllobacterium myrsinacearum TaxID=28101 RepID=A0A839F025_9HYPH|nr:type II secretion system major pseudopilin GspG [Phyllobacterium myrsinacearum]MBA8882030.1 general secretion pathway protein G [Phyllobacterium myrsinacearum]